MEGLVLSSIIGLDNEDGCTASNEYLANHWGVSKRYVRKILNKLSALKLISIEFENSKPNHTKRTIFANFNEPGLFVLGEEPKFPVGRSSGSSNNIEDNYKGGDIKSFFVFSGNSTIDGTTIVAAIKQLKGDTQWVEGTLEYLKKETVYISQFELFAAMDKYEKAFVIDGNTMEFGGKNGIKKHIRNTIIYQTKQKKKIAGIIKGNNKRKEPSRPNLPIY